MAYSENVASSPDDLIDKISTFAVSAGWTEDRNDLVSTNRTVTLHKGGDYIHLWNDSDNGVKVIGSIGYDSGEVPTNQTLGANNACVAPIGVGPYTKVYMFADNSPAEHVHVVIEATSGVFFHLSFGLLDKFGSYTGGTYFDASYWPHVSAGAQSFSGFYNKAIFDSTWGTATAAGLVPANVRLDIAADGLSNSWFHANSAAAARLFTSLCGNGVGLPSPALNAAYYRNSATFSGQVLLQPIQVTALRTGGFWSPIGAFPNVRVTNMERYNPADEITIGSDVWKIFPFIRKGSSANTTTEAYSQNMAYAYKKVT